MEHIVIASRERINEFKEEDFGIYVATGLQSNSSDSNTPLRRIGKVVQVRQEAGAWGSDIVFLRHWDGDLWMHENQSFYKVPKEFTTELDELYKERTSDTRKTPYSMGGKFKRKGFIIPSKVKEGESTPLRDVRNKIINLIDEKLNNEI